MPEQHWSHDIRDPEAFVGRIVDRSRRTLDFHQRERLHQFLLIALWELALVYDPGEPQFPSNFSGWAGTLLPRRIIDWERTPEEGGRTIWTKPKTGSGKQYAESYERVRPSFVALDSELGSALTERIVDRKVRGPSALHGVLREGSGRVARRANQVGKNTSRRAA